VEVTKNGKIDGACDGDNEWDNALHGTTIEVGWLWVQLGEIMEGFGNIPLLVTNEDDDSPQLKL
jgi:hypothetical protein